MSSTSDIRVREMVIDRYLRNRKGITLEELQEKVNRVMEMEQRPTVSARNTIAADMMRIENTWNTVIDKKREGYRLVFFYRDPTFSIYRGLFTDEELSILHCALQRMIERMKDRADQTVMELKARIGQRLR